jgi:glycosyltransferase involved in cell wall biosynthesis
MEIINSYGEMNYIRQNGEGVSNARNEGCEVSNNPYICFIDGDDYWYDDHLYEISEVINVSNEDIVIWWSAMDMILKSSYDETKYNQFTINYINTFKNWHDELHYYYLTRYPICTSTVCLKRNRFEAVGGFLEDYAIGEDIEMWSRMVGNPKENDTVFKSEQIEVITGFKHIHEDNTTEGGTQSFVFETNDNPLIFEEQMKRMVNLMELPTMEDRPERISEEVWKEICERYIKVI